MTAEQKKIWKLRATEPAAEQIQQLALGLNINSLTARALLFRGIDGVESGAEFLQARLQNLPDPDLLPDMMRAVERLEQALRHGEKIAVHGDYDVDGITGCVLLVETLRQLGAEVEYHIPLRLRDGYGLSAEAIRAAKADGCRLLISVDCGVTAAEEADLASELGLDLIVTDHHQPPDKLPKCLALINPHLPESRFPWNHLAGVGVAFFLLIALRRSLRENGYFNEVAEPDLRFGLDLVALGTIADIVPLGGVNRILVRAGLDLLDNSRRPGIQALKNVADVRSVTCGTVGFRLAPRLNAAGRLEDAALGVRLLLTDDIDKARDLAALLDGFNRDRQVLEQQTLEQAIAQVDAMPGEPRYSLVLADERWHSGVIGIVASRLVERYHCPVVMIALGAGLGKGSARSIRALHLYHTLQECDAFLEGFGGHAMAAGLTIKEDFVADFRRQFDARVRDSLAAEDLRPVLLHDGEIGLGELTMERVDELEQLAPFGLGNPQPAFVARNVRLKAVKTVGKAHLRFTAEQEGQHVGCIAFGMAERQAELPEIVDLLFRPTINHWQGRRTLQLQIADIAVAGQEMCL